MITAFDKAMQQGIFYLVPPELDPERTTPAQAAEAAEASGPTTDLPVVRDDDDLDRVLRDYLGVKVPATKCCDLHQTPWDAVHDAFFARSIVAIWKASRGMGGKSFTLSALAMAEALFLRADVNILGGSGVQSKRVLEAIGKMWDHPGAPRHCLKSHPGNQIQKLVWENRILALMASQTSVRGPHPQRLRLDEVDEMKQTILDAALGQPMGKGWVQAHVVGASTHQYPDGTMTRMMKRARETEGWRMFEWCLSGNSGVATETGTVRLQDLKPGAKVWAYTGVEFTLVPVSDVWSNGVRRTIRIITEDGSIECTPEHRIRTVGGWRRAGELQAGSRIVTGRAVRVRPAEATQVENVPDLLSGSDGQTEHEPAGRHDDGQGNWPSGQASFVTGSASRRTAGGFGAVVHAVLSVWAVCRRLLPARISHRRRSLRTTAPNQAGQRGARHRAGAAGEDHGSGPDYFVRPGSTSVVEIAAGRDIEVWDLSLPKHHAFMANGHVVHNCYRENLEPHGWLSLAEVARKKAILTVQMWDTEIELQEPSTEGRAFDTGKVDQAFQPGDAIEATDTKVVLEAPVAGAKYGTGGDWAKKKNRTVITTIRHDVTPARVVCIRMMNRMPWPDMAEAFDVQAREYPGTACHDNTGLGQVVHDLLTVASEAFDMIGRARAEMLSEYIGSVEHAEITWTRNDDLKPLAVAYSEHKYATRDDIYKGTKDGSGKHHLPDTISSAALAWRACGGVTGASTVRQPDAKDNPNLQRGIVRGRLSSYVKTGATRTDADDQDPDDDPGTQVTAEPEKPRRRWRLKE